MLGEVRVVYVVIEFRIRYLRKLESLIFFVMDEFFLIKFKVMGSN